MEKTVKAWHFLREDYRLGYEDGRIVKAGDTVTVDCDPILCERGLHGSKRVIDALKFAPGPIVCQVEIGGTIIHGDDKLVGTTRYVEWTLDATWILHEFACWCASQALKSAKVTDERSWNAINVKLRWLRGEATDAEVSAARSAAESAAWSAAESAAWYAAESAAWSAAESAAWYAAEYAAWHAARYAAESAAWSAARSAAESSAWSAQNNKLTAMLNSSE